MTAERTDLEVIEETRSRTDQFGWVYLAGGEAYAIRVLLAMLSLGETTGN